MRKTALCIMFAVLMLAIAAAAANQLGIADKRDVTFFDPVLVGDTVLPAGDYTVIHEMKGDEHMMVFTRTGHKSAQARVKCTLKPLNAPAVQSQTEYKLNAAKERVLTRLVFKGDRAEHLFQ